jgi:hypothetical protein
MRRWYSYINKKNCIKQRQLNCYAQDFVEATSASVEDSVSLISSSKAHLKQVQFEDFYNTLGQRFVANGDYNAKHTDTGSRLISFKERELLKTMESMNLKYLSTVEPTYWPSDRNKLPDLVDLCVAKGIPQDFAIAKSCFDLSSDHSQILITLTADALNQEKEPI